MKSRALLAAAVFAGGSAPAVAQNAPAVAAAPAPAWTAAQNYESGTRNLQAGRWFERAAAQFGAATKAEPGNFRYHLALGCARASRAAALAYAAYHAEELAGQIRDYPQELSDWEAAQKDPESDGYKSERPTLPPPFTFWTKDDNQPYRLSPKAVRARFRELSMAATADWEKARDLAATDAERAEAEYVRGWGLLLLDAYEQGMIPGDGEPVPDTPEEADDASEEDVPPKPSARLVEARKALAEAVERAPQNALYQQAQGDVLLGGATMAYVLKEDTPAWAAYQKALELEPRNSALWYRLYQTTARAITFDPKPENEQRRARARTYLLNAAKSDALNANFWYQLAALDLRAAPYWKILNKPVSEREQAFADVLAGATEPDRKTARNAITLLERANAAPHYASVRYQPAVPVLLTRAWDYLARHAYFWEEGARFRELARETAGFALVSARENRTGDAVRAARALIGMGYRLIGDWPVKDKTPGDGTVLTSLVGRAITAIGHDTLVKVYDATGDEAGQRQAQALYNAFKERVTANREATLAEMERSEKAHEGY